MRYASVTLALALLLAVSAAPAEAGEPGWRIRAFGALLDPNTSQIVVNGDGDDILVEADRAFGGGFGVEYQFHRFLGVDAGLVGASPEVSLSADIPGLGAIRVSDGLSTVLLTADLLVHLTPGSEILDLYLGGGIAGVNPGGMSFDVLGIDRLNVEAESYITWAVRAGLDLSLGADSGWAATLGARYVPGDVDFRQLGVPGGIDDTSELGFDILTLTAGVAYRF
jgi:opacity protein-like surface antigen